MATLELESTAKAADFARTEKVDMPRGARTVRVEPIIDGEGWVVVAFRIFWPDGTDYGAAAMLKVTSLRKPSYQLDLTRSLDGAKVVAQAFLPDGAVNVAVRVTAADAAANLPTRKIADSKGA